MCLASQWQYHSVGYPFSWCFLNFGALHVFYFTLCEICHCNFWFRKKNIATLVSSINWTIGCILMCWSFWSFNIPLWASHREFDTAFPGVVIWTTPAWGREFELEVSGLFSGIHVVASGMRRLNEKKSLLLVNGWQANGYKLALQHFWSNISNPRDSVSSGYPNTKKRVENNITG